MANAKRDENRVPTLLGVSSVDGITPTLAAVNPSNNKLQVEADVTIETGDIEIGAVEIKDATTDTRATVGANGLYVDVRTDVNTLEKTPTTVASAQATVTTAGTRVQLATNTCLGVIVKAKSTNTGLIYVGDVTVTSSNGFILSAGESVTLAISNTNKAYIDSSVNGEGVSYIYIAT